MSCGYLYVLDFTWIQDVTLFFVLFPGSDLEAKREVRAEEVFRYYTAYNVV